MARKIKNTFVGGKMQKDTDSRLIPNGEYRDALNWKSANSSSSDVGALENSLSNKKLTNLSFGANVNTIGMLVDGESESIYWFITSDSGDYVVEYKTDSEVSSIVLEDTSAGVLNFSTDFLITGVNLLVDNDNNVRLLAWTDNLNPPRLINIARAKTYGANNFTEADISVILAPPLNSPFINLSEGVDGQENNIEERFLRFAHRYKYLDGGYSALSAFSEVAFLPETFRYDFSASANESMVNNFSNVNIAFNTGSSLVKSIGVVFKDSGSNNVWLIDDYNKDDQGWADNTEVNVNFSNNKVFEVLPSDQLARMFDAVPLKAKSQEIIGNRLIYGYYTENYDIEDCIGVEIPIKYTLEQVNTAISVGTATRSLKSNRDLEIGIIYSDDNGRMTTVLTSTENSIYISNGDAINQNQIKVILENKAPCFANKYRFFIKQTRVDYDTFVPTLWYQDGIYVWIRLVGNEAEKIVDGEFLYVKSDVRALLTEITQTRVLEISVKEENFISGVATTTTEEIAGTYFKIKPVGFSMNTSDATDYQFSSYASSAQVAEIQDLANVIEKASYYGITGLDDLTESGTYTGLTDVRYQIEIVTAATPDTFRYSDDDGASWVTTAITGGSQSLVGAVLGDLGVDVTFAATTGHTAVTDKWVVSAKSSSDNAIGTDTERFAYGIFKSLPSRGDDTLDNVNIVDRIEAGATITIIYDEYNEETEFVQETFASSRRYDNLEEWFYGDSIDLGIDDDRIWFRRGDSFTIAVHGDNTIFEQDPTGDMTMIIKSIGEQNSFIDNQVKIRGQISIFQTDQLVIFETKPLNDNSQPFYEIGRTYDIDSNQNHLGFDGADTDQTASLDAELLLPVFNCYSWGNGFESYKIRDLFNETSFKLDSRPSETVIDYRQNIRTSSLTYGKVYEQTTNYNGLNEFNLSTQNFKDLDDKYESIQKIFSRDTDLIIFQEDKIHVIPFQKDILFDADGNGNIRESTNILGTARADAGEFGISRNPESFAFYGNYIYFTDTRRGVVCRRAANGTIEISKLGMKDFFRDSFRDLPDTKKVGAFDLFNKQYVLHVDDTARTETILVPCGTTINSFELGETLVYTALFVPSTGDVPVVYNITTGTVNIKVTEGVTVTDIGNVTGSATYNYSKISDSISSLIITITPISTEPVFSITVDCPIDLIVPVVAVNDAYPVITGDTANLTVLFNDTFDIPVTVTEDTAPATGSIAVQGDKTIDYTNDGVSEIYTQDNAASSSEVNATTGWSATSVTLTSNTTLPAFGTYSLKAVATSGTNDYIDYDFSITNTQIYTVKMWVKGNIGSNASISGWTGFATSPNTAISADNTWTLHKFDVTANTTGTGTVRVVVASSGSVSDTLFVDLVNITKKIVNDSFIYQIDDGTTTDTATVTLTINDVADPVAAGGAGTPVTAFNISAKSFYSSSDDGQGACSFAANIIMYHDGVGALPLPTSDVVYEDSFGLIPFNGNNLFYSIGGATIKISPAGVVLTRWICV